MPFNDCYVFQFNVPIVEWAWAIINFFGSSYVNHATHDFLYKSDSIIIILCDLCDSILCDSKYYLIFVNQVCKSILFSCCTNSTCEFMQFITGYVNLWQKSLMPIVENQKPYIFNHKIKSSERPRHDLGTTEARRS